MIHPSLIPAILANPRLADPALQEWEKYTPAYYAAMDALADFVAYPLDGDRRGFLEFRYHVPCAQCGGMLWLTGFTARECLACGSES